jgi:rod shape-determining protein MreD
VRGFISFVLVAVTVVFQLTVVDRIAFPGGSGPDLVLVEVAALALAGGPLAGALTGFWGGLALDVAPPGSHFTGQDALVFCLVGYACGLLADSSSGDGVTEGGHTALFEIMVTAAGAMCGEALLALLGVMLSDPRVTWSAITNVLPVAALYDILLCPFVLYATAAALRVAGTRRDASQAGGFRARPSGLALPGASQGTVRRAGGGSVPRLRLSEAGRGHGSMAGSRPAGASGRLGPGREPRLKLGRANSLTGHRGSGVGLGAAFGGTRSGSSALRISGFSSSSTGRSLLGGSLFSRSSPSLGTSRSSTSRGSSTSLRPSAFGGSTAFGRSSGSLRPSAFGRSSAFRRRGTKMRAPGGRTGSAPRLAHIGRRRGLGRIFGVRRPAQPKSPGQGWLRHTSARRASLGRGWTGASTPGLRSGSRGFKGSRGPARLRMPRPGKLRAKRRWRTGGYR